MRRYYEGSKEYERGYEDGRKGFLRSLDESAYDGEPLSDVVYRMAKNRFKTCSVKRDGKSKYEGINIVGLHMFELDVRVNNPNKECDLKLELYGRSSVGSSELDTYISVFQDIKMFIKDSEIESKKAGYEFNTYY